MRVAVVGATGNVGSATLRALADDSAVTSIVAIARRPPSPAGRGHQDRVEWHAADIATDPLDLLAGADAVIHLAWLIQPSHDESTMRSTNVEGTRRLVASMVSFGVPRLIYASSVGTYSKAGKHPRQSETWPTTGIRTSTYSRHKAEVEALLDEFESRTPLEVVRMRTSLVFQRQAASEVHRLFLGPLMPWHLPRALRLVPGLPSLMFQATHADDIASAYVLALHSQHTGAFNIAAEPVLTPQLIAAAVEGRVVPMPRRLVRALVWASYRAHLQPAEPGWLDMATGTPIMDTTRARSLLGWTPRISAVDALVELLDGIGDGAGAPTPALAPRA